jgi:nucleoside-diphosphate-sugar epimerase
MSRVLVTGAGGFIASSLVPDLVAVGHEVVAIVRPGSPLPPHLLVDRVAVAAGDLGAPAEVRELVVDHRPDTIVDLAVVRGSDLDAARRVNVVGFTALLDAAAEIGAHLVHTGSSFEYGSHDEAVGAHVECHPSTALGVSKLEASRRLADAVRAKRVHGCTLRLFHVYGANEPITRLVPRAIEAAMTGSPLPLTPAGLGHDLIHVDDVTAAMRAAISRRLNVAEPIDIATGVCTTNEAVVDLVEAITGRPIDRRVGAFPARPHDRATWLGDPAGVTGMLGRAPLSLHDGLTRLVARLEPRTSRS